MNNEQVLKIAQRVNFVLIVLVAAMILVGALIHRRVPEPTWDGEQWTCPAGWTVDADEAKGRRDEVDDLYCAHSDLKK